MAYYGGELARSGEERTETFVPPRMDGLAFGDDVATLTTSLPTALASQLDRPVFTDDTGRRAEVLQWGGRGFCLMGAVLCAALAVTLQTHILLPSLEKAFLGSSEGLIPAAVISETSVSGVAPRTEVRGESDQVGVAGQRLQLSEPTLDSADTATRQVAETPVIEQRAGRATGTSATVGSDTKPVAGAPTPSASTTRAAHRSTRAGAVQGSEASKAKCRPPRRLTIRTRHRRSGTLERPRQAPVGRLTRLSDSVQPPRHEANTS